MTNSPTPRAARIYERSGDATILTQRLDWEIPIRDGKDASGAPGAGRGQGTDFRNILASLGNFLDSEPAREFQAVVIKDLAKGLIRGEVIDLLIRHPPRVPWFISTKRGCRRRLQTGDTATGC